LSGLARPSALAPFRIRNYRFQWPADLLTSWAFEMETLILGWYVLVETGSVLLLTLFASLSYIGTLIAPMFGVVGDRIGHRDLLAMMRATYAVLAATLMMLALTGHASLRWILPSNWTACTTCERMAGSPARAVHICLVVSICCATRLSRQSNTSAALA
jgi:MFS family permease